MPTHPPSEGGWALCAEWVRFCKSGPSRKDSGAQGEGQEHRSGQAAQDSGTFEKAGFSDFDEFIFHVNAIVITHGATDGLWNLAKHKKW